MGKKSRRNKSKPSAAKNASAPPAAAGTAVGAAATSPASASARMSKGSANATKAFGGGGKGKGVKSGRSSNNDNSGLDEVTEMLSRLQSRRGARNPFTPTTKAELDAVVTPPTPSSDEHDPVKAPSSSVCWICLEGPEDGNCEALRRNCACRGEDGYAHLSCLASFCATRSEGIWTGRTKAAHNSTWLAFGWPWESCHSCKHFFSGRLKLDIAREFARSTEGMVGGDRAFRHVTALSWVTKSIGDVYNPCAAENFERAKSEFERLLELIKQTYPVYEGENPALVYIHVTLQQLEAETLTNYAQSVAIRLGMIVSEVSTVSGDQMTLYRKWHKMSTSSIAAFEKLKLGIMGKDAALEAQLDRCILHSRSQAQHWSKHFSHLALGNVKEDSGEAIKLSEKLMHSYIKERGESSTEAIRFSLVHAQEMITVSPEHWRPFEAIDLLMKTLKTAVLSLGPSHQLTKDLRWNLRRLLVRNRRVANICDPYRDYCPVHSYEEDCDIYIVDTRKIERNVNDGVGVGTEMGWDPADVVLLRGSLVKCVDLVKSSHLNGKRAWVKEYDEDTGRQLIHFEDDDTKPCLVKSDNLRLLFFGEEYETKTNEDEDSDSESEDGDSSGDNRDEKEGDDDKNDIPDLG